MNRCDISIYCYVANTFIKALSIDSSKNVPLSGFIRVKYFNANNTFTALNSSFDTSLFTLMNLLLPLITSSSDIVSRVLNH